MNRSCTADLCAPHHAPIRSRVVHGEVLAHAVVPERDRARLPTEAAGELGPVAVVDQVLQQRRALLLGHALEPDHGYPLRGLMGAIPSQKAETDRYLWKGGKWLRGLEFTAEDQPGFWENAGYSNTANVWREERYWTGR